MTTVVNAWQRSTGCRNTVELTPCHVLMSRDMVVASSSNMTLEDAVQQWCEDRYLVIKDILLRPHRQVTDDSFYQVSLTECYVEFHVERDAVFCKLSLP